MNEEDYRVFRTFLSVEEAAPMLEILKREGVDYITNNYNSNIGSTFGSSNDPFKVELQLLPEQFDKVERLLQQEASRTITSVPTDHYLVSFTNEELMDVLRKEDEWTEEDVVMAKLLLEQRGVMINTRILEEMKAKRLEELRQPETGSIGWTVAGYLSAVFGGLLGVLMGWYMMSLKKTIPNGERVYAYDKPTRSAGRGMFVVGILSLIIWSLLLMNRIVKI